MAFPSFAMTCGRACSPMHSARSSAATTRSRCSVAMRARQAPTTRSPSIQYLDLKTYLVGDINTKVDRASMAHSLEVREPLMDHPLVEWLATLPSSLKVRGQEGKWLLKKAMEPQVCRGRSCTGRKWALPCRSRDGSAVRCRNRLRDAVLGERLATTGFFNRRYLEELVDHHQSGRRDYSSLAVDAPDVRCVPAQRRGRVRRRRAAPRGRVTAPCASCTSSITRFRRTAVIRFALSPSCANSARADGKRCSSRRPGTGAGSADVEDVDGWRFHRTPLQPNWLSSVPGCPSICRRWRPPQPRIKELVRDVPPGHPARAFAGAECAAGIAGRTPPAAFRSSTSCGRCGRMRPSIIGRRREGSLRYRASRALETFALRHADHVTTICDGLRDEIEARGIAARRITVIANAVDIDAIPHSAAEPDAELRARARPRRQDRASASRAPSMRYEGLDLLIEATALLAPRHPRICACFSSAVVRRKLPQGDGRRERWSRTVA